MRHFNVLISAFILLICSAPVIAEDSIQLYYSDRIPYAVTDTQGEVSGLCATPAANAFKQAGIPFKWKRMPFKRQLETIKYNKKMACGIGWFKNPERERFARFTEEIYQDKPAISISKRGNKALAHHRSLNALLTDNTAKLLVKDGFSYGVYIDALIKKFNPQHVVVVNSTNIQMLQMILSERADYFFMSEEEAEHIILSTGYEVSQFQLQHYNDMPDGNRRYIICSQQVSPEIIELLNQSLK
jgi:polar amino acid transport system substrate-binding protein